MINKFSIILPVRNGGEYLKVCVQSILAQSYPHFNLKILDNNSSDNTVEYLQSLNDTRIKIYTQQNNLNINENWARALEIQKNEFTTLIGHDDILAPNFLHEINQLIFQHPSATLFHTHFNFIDKDGDIIKACKPMPTSINKHQFLELFLSNKIDSMGTGYVFKSELYDRLGGIPVRYPNLLYADFELWYNFTKLGYEAISTENCFSFRLHQSTTTTSSIITKLKAFEVFVNFLIQTQQQDATTQKEIEKYSKIYLDSNCQSMCHKLLKTPISQRDKSITIKYLITQFKVFAKQLHPSKPYNPYTNKSIVIALFIDSNCITRNLFLKFRKIYSKPILQ